jgi:hypothetical protein
MRQVHSSPAFRLAIILLGVTQVLSPFPAAKCRPTTLHGGGSLTNKRATQLASASRGTSQSRIRECRLRECRRQNAFFLRRERG